LLLDDGETQRHYYNAIFRPRLRRWSVYRFDAY